MYRPALLVLEAVILGALLGAILGGCDVDRGGLYAPAADAALGDVVDLVVDTAPPACIGTPNITIDNDCCQGCDGRPCQVGLGLDHYPCAFGAGWVVAACSQCWGLP